MMCGPAGAGPSRNDASQNISLHIGKSSKTKN